MSKNTLRIRSIDSKIIFDVCMREQLARTYREVCRRFEDFHSDECEVAVFYDVMMCSLVNLDTYEHFGGKRQHISRNVGTYLQNATASHP
jgi:hypothetical protein